MDHVKVYNQIIQHRKDNAVNDAYTERHHIVPKSIGGNDTNENLVNLTPREHFVCHLLLVKIYCNTSHYYKMIKAFNMMCNASSRHQDRYINNRHYGWLKTELSRAMTISQAGKHNSQYMTRWITNGAQSIKIKMSDDITSGWRLGRVINAPNIRTEIKMCATCVQHDFDCMWWGLYITSQKSVSDFVRENYPRNRAAFYLMKKRIGPVV
jgi:hypothetical protein